MKKSVEYSNKIETQNIRNNISKVLKSKEFRNKTDAEKKEYIKKILEEISEEDEKE